MIKPPESLSIGELISHRKVFFVHVYQRTYAWEEEEIGDFIGDIRALDEARWANPDEPRRHFLGGIVSIEHFESGVEPGHKYEVVDGQQRLATFMITIHLTLRALEEIVSQARVEGDLATGNKANAIATQTRNEYLWYNRIELGTGNTSQPLRLTLSRADHPFFEKLIREESVQSSRSSHDRLLHAHNKLWEDLFHNPVLDNEQLSVQDKLKHVLHLRSSILEDCHVIHIVSDDHNEAYQLFSILNDRGRTLSDGDLLRVYTMGLLEGYSDFQGQLERYWDHILERKPSEVDGLLRSYFPSHIGKRAPRRGLYDSYREHFFENKQPPIERDEAATIEECVSNLNSECDIYYRVADGLWPYENPEAGLWERDRLFRLITVLRHDLCIPLLLSAYQSLNEADFSKLVNLLERVYFRYKIIVGAHVGTLGNTYYRHAREMRQSDQYKLAALESELRKLSREKAPDDLFRLKLVEELKYRPRSSQYNRRVKYFLTTLEDYYIWYKNGAPGKPKPDNTRAIDLDKVTIEHIYPQNPSQIDSELEDRKHDIGNLTFWAPNDNRAAGNDRFLDKVDRYAESSVKLTRKLAELSAWTEQSLNRRQKELIKMALKVFVV